jgi:hypothetical protein
MRSRLSWALLTGAALILAAYGAAEMLGLRETTSILLRADAAGAAALGRGLGLLFFLLSYALAIFVAPILLIAVAVCEVLLRLCSGSRPAAQAAPGGDPPQPGATQA